MRNFLCREAEVNEEIEKYGTFACVNDRDTVYYYRTFDGALCKYEIDSNQIHLMPAHSIPIQGGEPVEWMFLDENIIISITGNGKYVLLYNLIDQTSASIHINDNTSDWANYAYAYYSKGTLIVFSRKDYRFILIDIYQKAIKEDIVLELTPNTIFFDGCMVGNRVWLFEQNTENVYWFDLVTKKSGVSSLGEKIRGINCILSEQNSILIMNETGSIYRYFVEKGKIIKLWESKNNHYAGKLISTDRYFFELPAAGKDIVRINKSNYVGEIVLDYPEDFRYKTCTTEYKYTAFFESEGKIFSLMRFANYILSIDKASGDIEWIKPILPEKKEEDEYYNLIKTRHVFNGNMTFEDFILRNWDYRYTDLGVNHGSLIWKDLYEAL